MSAQHTTLPDRISRIESAAKYIYEHLILQPADNTSTAPGHSDAANMAALILTEARAVSVLSDQAESQKITEPENSQQAHTDSPETDIKTIIARLPEDVRYAVSHYFAGLVSELDKAHAAANVCRMASESGDLGEASSISTTLFQCTGHIYEVAEQMQALTQAADGQGGEA